MKSNGKVTIKNSKTFDFLALMYKVSNADHVAESNSFNQENLSDEKEVRQIANQISDEWKKEMEIFLNHESYIALSLISMIVEKDAYTEVGQFIKMVKDVELEKLLNAFVNIGFNQEHVECDFGSVDSVLKTVQNLGVREEEKWKIFYLIQDGEKTRERLLKLFTYFYVNFYQSQEEKFYEIQSQFIKNLVPEEPRLTKFLQNYGGLQEGKDAIVFPSYNQNDGFMMSQIITDGPLICVLGMNSLDENERQVNEKELIELLRIFTDERRFKLLQLLSKRPYYGFELSQEMNVSNSTISYHLTALLSNQFVSSRRIENKVYYETNKERINEVIDQLKSVFE